MLPLAIERLRKKNKDEDILIKAHHIMMCRYGYIPLEEFKKMPIPTFLSLFDLIMKDIGAENTALGKMKRRR